MTDADVAGLLAEVDHVVVARGRARRDLTAAATDPNDLKGPSGKYRAPMVVSDRTLFVGFGDAVLADLGG